MRAITAGKIREIVKAGGKGDLADSSAAHRRIGQVTVAARRAPFPHMAHQPVQMPAERRHAAAMQSADSGSPRWASIHVLT